MTIFQLKKKKIHLLQNKQTSKERKKESELTSEQINK